MNRPSLRHHHLMGRNCYAHAPVSRLVGGWLTSEHGNSSGSLLRTVCPEVTHFNKLAPFPSFAVILAALERLGFACLVSAAVLHMPLRPM